MFPVPPETPDVSSARIRTAKHVLAGYALLAGTFVALWVASHPVVVAGLLGSVVLVVAAVTLVLGVIERSRDEAEQPRRICIPGTTVCVDL